jgi:phage shock protein A
MGIFQRTSEIVAANVNDFVDRFEQPDRMLRQALREMEELLATTSAAVARSLAAERMLRNAQSAQQQQIDAWKRRAKAAIARNDEALARRAVTRQLDHQRTFDSLTVQLAEAGNTNTSLRRQLDLLRDKYAAAQGRLASLTASQTAVVARGQVGATTASSLGSSRAVARFEHFCRKLEFANAEASALVELDSIGPDNLQLEFDEQETEIDIDAELARLKQDTSRT